MSSCNLPWVAATRLLLRQGGANGHAEMLALPAPAACCLTGPSWLSHIGDTLMRCCYYCFGGGTDANQPWCCTPIELMPRCLQISTPMPFVVCGSSVGGVNCLNLETSLLSRCRRAIARQGHVGALARVVAYFVSFPISAVPLLIPHPTACPWEVFS